MSKVKAAKETDKLETREKMTKDPPGGDEPAAGSSSSPMSTTSKTADSPEKSQSRDTAAELLSEATSLLKTIRSMKVLQVKELKPLEVNDCGAVGLLDDGATNGLR